MGEKMWEYCCDAENYNEARKYGRMLMNDGYADYRIRKEYGWYLVDGLKPGA
jgi:hypothetical protein